jgi:hypothetical protein
VRTYSPELTSAQAQITEAIDLMTLPAELQNQSTYFWRLRQEPEKAPGQISIEKNSDQLLINAEGEPFGRYTIYRKINLAAERTPWLRIELSEAGLAEVVQIIETDQAVEFFSISAGW